MSPAELRAAAAELSALADHLESPQLELAGADAAALAGFDWKALVKILGPIAIQLLQQLLANQPTPVPVPGPKK